MRVLLSHPYGQGAEGLHGAETAGDAGWQPEVAPTAAACRARLAAQEYAAIVWDLDTPGAQGLREIRRIRELAPSSVLLVTAAPGEESLAARARDEGADGYLVRTGDGVTQLLAGLALAPALGSERQAAAALRRELEWLGAEQGALLDSLPQPLLMLAAAGEIRACNRAASQVLGQPPERLLGTPLGTYLQSPPLLTELLTALHELTRPLPPPGPGLLAAWREGEQVGAEVLLNPPDGGLRRSRLTLRRLRPVEGSTVLAACGAQESDLEAELARQLLGISVALNSGDRMEDVLRGVAEAAVRLAHGVCCEVRVRGEEGGAFASGWRHCPGLESSEALCAELARVAEQAVEVQAPVQVEGGAGGDPPAIVAVPLRAEDAMVGALTLVPGGAQPVSEAVLNALQVLAAQAAVAVRNRQLLALAAERSRRLEAAAAQARQEEARARMVMEAAAAVAESRDLSQTLTQIARGAAQEIGFERVRVFLTDHQAGVLEGRVEAYREGSALRLEGVRVPLRAGADPLADAALSGAAYAQGMAAGGPQEGGGYEQLCVPLRWQGELVGVIAADNRTSGRRITAQQTRLLRALATLVTVAIERARMEGVRDQLVSTVSHELRRPLASIQAYNELLLGEDAGPINEEQRVYLQRVEEGCVRLGRMIEELLDWSRLRAGKITVRRQAVDLREVVDQVLAGLRPSAQQGGVEVKVEAEGELPPVETDSGLLEQVVSNLVENAIKYNHPGGRVTVRLGHEDGDATIEVTDTGPGVPVELQGRLFEEFERGPRELTGNTEGTGLGLSIARRLTQYLGGSLALTSQVGEGSTFVVRLPRQAA